MNNIGITNNWNLFKKYLEYKNKVTIVGKSISKVNLVKYEVPQGNVLGPLLFLIYVY